uniref:Uncharacterized protein n=1 Tax=viral metagenome TaxID=1070528 RepID=A0A6M3JYY4_9ZZZZ
MHLKEVLSKSLKWFADHLLGAILSLSLAAIIAAWGGFYRFSTSVLDNAIQKLNTPTPLWATIGLVLLVGVYTYLKARILSRSYATSCIKTKKYDPVTKKVIKLFFDAGHELSINEIGVAVSDNINVTMFHLDILLKDRLIKQTQSSKTIEAAFIGEEVYDMYDITPLGRKYVVENGLS